ncbi:hypothetical protein Ancab_019635 [Ancistrocladus abbreviatus]
MISLDGATSTRKRFDVAHVLISTNLLGLISATIPIVIDDYRFPIKVFEEATGETIFLRGGDRARAIETWFLGDDDYNENREIGHESTTYLHFLSASKSHGRTVLPEIQRSNRMVMDSKMLIFNDDFPYQQDNLEQSYSAKSDELISGKSRIVGASLGNYMSPAKKNSEGELDRIEEVIPGPFPQLDWSQPMGLNRDTSYPPLSYASATHSVGLGPDTQQA